jgi:hypothetical protein
VILPRQQGFTRKGWNRHSFSAPRRVQIELFDSNLLQIDSASPPADLKDFLSNERAKEQAASWYGTVRILKLLCSCRRVFLLMAIGSFCCAQDE